jgi:hypothetical protein
MYHSIEGLSNLSIQNFKTMPRLLKKKGTNERVQADEAK